MDFCPPSYREVGCNMRGSGLWIMKCPELSPCTINWVVKRCSSPWSDSCTDRVHSLNCRGFFFGHVYWIRLYVYLSFLQLQENVKVWSEESAKTGNRPIVVYKWNTVGILGYCFQVCGLQMPSTQRRRGSGMDSNRAASVVIWSGGPPYQWKDTLTKSSMSGLMLQLGKSALVDPL